MASVPQMEWLQKEFDKAPMNAGLEVDLGFIFNFTFADGRSQTSIGTIAIPHCMARAEEQGRIWLHMVDNPRSPTMLGLK